MKNKQIISIVLFVFTLHSCTSNNEIDRTDIVSESLGNDQYTLTDTQFKSAGMKLGKLLTSKFNDVIEANGIIDVQPNYQASVSSYFGGTVIEIRLITGQKVQKGQTLFVLENPEFVEIQQEYLETKSKLTYLKVDFERQERLAKDKASSQKKYLKAETEYQMNLVTLKSIHQKLLLMNINPDKLTIDNIQTSIHIKSPISGYVSKININKGAFVNSSQPAMHIVNMDKLHVELNIYEKDLPFVKEKQHIQFKIQGQPSDDFSARVEQINKSIDPENRTIRVHGKIEKSNYNANLTPGMYVSAKIFTTAVTKKCLPQDAIVEINKKYYVLVAGNSLNSTYVFSQKEVTVGATQNELTEILNVSDFEKDATFLVKGSFNLIAE